MMAWSYQRTRYGFRDHLTPWLVVQQGGDSEKRREDGWDDLPPLSCGGYPVGRILRVEDDTGGTRLPFQTEDKGIVT